ncbi:MAG: hypothetical protein HKN24_13320 [Acidimicrobiales bacterium]|nr:hypothetical protein [Acidimicrobiales bacterium]
MTAPSDLDAAFEAKLAQMRDGNTEGSSDGAVTEASSPMWLTHRYPVAGASTPYGDRCVHVGRHWVCRRCSILYPIGVVVAVLFAAGIGWPETWDMTAIWLLCVPATVAYCGEALGLFDYNPRVQSWAMAMSAVGFGRGLGYEFTERWSGEFWWPVTVFGGLWFFATLIGHLRS